METKVSANVQDELRRERAATALTAARLAYRRGNLEEAFRLAREALLIEERFADAHELIGDILRDQNKDEAALQEYRTALEIEPKLASAEEKIGILSIERDGLLRFEQHRQTLLADSTKRKFEERKPAVAGTLSMFLPGAGQWYNDDIPRAIALFCIVAVSAGFFLYPVMGELSEINAKFPALARGGHSLSRGGPLRFLSLVTEQLQQKSALYLIWILFNGLLCAGAWTYSVIEAALTAARANRFFRKHLGIE